MIALGWVAASRGLVCTTRDEIHDLQRLLDGAGIEPPYVLVGHSYGGVVARVFAEFYPKETAGLVLIDTMGRDGRRRQLALWPQSQAPEIRRAVATTVMGRRRPRDR
jgi:pimeloyl-ACP methyl ester carboxylesterase